MTELKHTDIIQKMTLEDKLAFCSGADYWTTKAFPQYGIPSIRMADGPHGLRVQAGDIDDPGLGKSLPATCFPPACLSACSWDRDLLQQMGEAIAQEALSQGVSIVLGPGANLKRNPLCGRNFEYFSEDPLLSGEMAKSWIQGLQSQGVFASLKHFAGNNQEALRMQSDSLIDPRVLRELYLPGFEIAVREGKPGTVMGAYNLVNGVYCCEHEELLRCILRGEWGFEGVIVTDWGAMNDRVERFRAGLDLEMPGGVAGLDADVLEAVRSGKLTESLVDESVDRLLELVFRSVENRKPRTELEIDAHHQTARRIAAQSAVLMKNEDGILPLKPGRPLAVIGALAEHLRFQGAGSSFINITRLSSVLDGLTECGVPFTYKPGYTLKGDADEQLLTEALAAAREHEVAVVCVGLTEELEAEGFDRTDLQLSAVQNRVVEAVSAANPNTVVVLFGGSAVELPWLGKVKGLFNMYLPGQAGGLAAADLLTGAVNPSGKLAESYPLRYEDVVSAGFYENGGKQAQYRESLYTGYRYYDTAGMEVAFPFGHGLSYTTFAYSSLRLSPREVEKGGSLQVELSLRNTGSLAGAEVVQVYLRDCTGRVFRPEKELKGFAKVFLESGEEKDVSIELNRRGFAIYDPARQRWVVPAGRYEVFVGSSSRDIRLRGEVRVQGESVENPKNLPVWYLAPQGKPSQKDFEALLGKPITLLKALKKGEYTLNCSLKDMESSWVIRQVTRIVVNKLADTIGGKDESNPNYRMMVETALATPLRSMVTMSKGQMPMNLAKVLVALANGQVGKAIKAFREK